MRLISFAFVAGLVLFSADPGQVSNNTFYNKFLMLYTQADSDAGDGRPPSRVGGGGRNPCLGVPIAMVPGEDMISIEGDACQPRSPAAVAMTNNIEPTLWVYLPPSYSDPNLTAELTLIQNHRAIAQWPVRLPDLSGVICFQLPYELSTDQLYEWQFVVQLTDSPSDNPKVGGLIQHTIEIGDYWADKLTDLGQQRINQPQRSSLANEWSQLLSQEGLADIGQVALPNSCLVLDSE